ncbi:MAG: hypothetical protein ABEJ40_07865 [Haloarculaceae archaeon]
MSHSNDAGDDREQPQNGAEEGEAEQPTGDEPQPGPGEQPTGGEPQPATGGQPAGGQGQPPSEGQPAGGHAQPQAAGQQPAGNHAAGPATARRQGVGDLLGRPAIKREILRDVGFYAVVGIGLGFAALVAKIFGGGGDQGTAIGVFFAVAGIFVALAIGPVLAGLLSVRVNDALAGEEGRAVMLANFVGNAAGYLLMVVLTILFASTAADSGSSTGVDSGTGSLSANVQLGDYFLPIVGVALVVGAVAVAVTYLVRSIGSGRPAAR